MTATTLLLPPLGVYAALFTLWTLRRSRDTKGRSPRQRAAISKTQRIVFRYVLAGTLWFTGLTLVSRRNPGLLPIDLWTLVSTQKPGTGWEKLALLYFAAAAAIAVAVYLYATAGSATRPPNSERPMIAWMLAITLSALSSAVFFAYFWPSFALTTALILVAVHVALTALQLALWLPEHRAAVQNG
ncbi:hypothetical protein [Cryptosporangium phraense]|nr:hypothetical protein [Cryptosporangium phraense]